MQALLFEEAAFALARRRKARSHLALALQAFHKVALEDGERSAHHLATGLATKHGLELGHRGVRAKLWGWLCEKVGKRAKALLLEGRAWKTQSLQEIGGAPSRAERT